MKHPLTILTLILLISLILPPPLAVQAQTIPAGPDALLDEPDQQSLLARPLDGDGGRVLRSRASRLAHERLPAPGRTGDALSLPLFADARFTAWVLANQVGADGSLALSGQVEGRTDSSWMALVRDGQLTGFLQVGS